MNGTTDKRPTSMLFDVKGIRNLPRSLKELILDGRFLIVGSQVGGDLSKIASDFSEPDVALITHKAELCTMARKRGAIKQKRAGLEVMHNTIIGREVGKLDKRESLRLSYW